jgi:hypothetical protein
MQNMQVNMQNMHAKYAKLQIPFFVYRIIIIICRICTTNMQNMQKNMQKNMQNIHIPYFCIEYAEIFFAPSHSTRGQPSCFAHTTRAPAPPIPSGWGGLIYGIRWQDGVGGYHGRGELGLLR